MPIHVAAEGMESPSNVRSMLELQLFLPETFQKVFLKLQ